MSNLPQHFFARQAPVNLEQLFRPRSVTARTSEADLLGPGGPRLVSSPPNNSYPRCGTVLLFSFIHVLGLVRLASSRALYLKR